MTAEDREAGPVPRPVLLVTEAEFLGVCIGHGLVPKGHTKETWLDATVHARSCLHDDGTPMGRDERLALQRLASIGEMVREAGALVRLHDGPLPELGQRLAELEPDCKRYLAWREREARRRRAEKAKRPKGAA
jgi:hypothetical protein